jgi:hypothetical protein
MGSFGKKQPGGLAKPVIHHPEPAMLANPSTRGLSGNR